MTRPPEENPLPARSAGKWMILLASWCVGVLVFVGYIALLFLGFVRLFG